MKTNVMTRKRTALVILVALAVFCMVFASSHQTASAASGKWKKIGGKRVYVLANGKKASGLTKVKIKGKANLYFFRKGVPQKGWKKAGGKKFYFDPKTKKAVIGPKKIGKKTYVFTMKWYLAGTGLVKIRNKTYFAKKGLLQTGFVTYKSKTYYSTANGLVRGFKKIKGAYYWFDKKAFAMTKNKTVNGRKFGEDGKEVVRTTSATEVTTGTQSNEPTTERDEIPISITVSTAHPRSYVSKFSATNKEWFCVRATYTDGTSALVTNYDIDDQVITNMEEMTSKSDSTLTTIKKETGERVFTIKYKGKTATIALQIYNIFWFEDGSYSEAILED